MAPSHAPRGAIDAEADQVESANRERIGVVGMLLGNVPHAARDLDRTCGRPKLPQQHPEQRRLARSVGAQDGNELTGPDR